MTETGQTAASNYPPATGQPLIDAALAELAGIQQRPVSEQLEALTAAQEVLAQVLQSSRDPSQSHIPEIRTR